MALTLWREAPLEESLRALREGLQSLGGADTGAVQASKSVIPQARTWVGLQVMRQVTAREVTTEVDRYIGWPGQALSYKVGEMEFRVLRREAEKTLGAGFDLRAFHDHLLTQGCLPLPALRDEVLAWAQCQGAGQDSR